MDRRRAAHEVDHDVIVVVREVEHVPGRRRPGDDRRAGDGPHGGGDQTRDDSGRPRRRVEAGPETVVRIVIAADQLEGGPAREAGRVARHVVDDLDTSRQSARARKGHLRNGDLRRGCRAGRRNRAGRADGGPGRGGAGDGKEEEGSEEIGGEALHA